MTHNIKMVSKTALDGKGIFQLGLIQDFFKKMKLPLSQVKVEGDYFDLDRDLNRNFRRDFPRNSFKFNNSVIVKFVSKTIPKGFMI